MRRMIKNWDLNGKPITFYYLTSSIHKTIFGGLLSLFSFILMLTIAISSLLNFLYQRPTINSNIMFYINKKFMYLESMKIKGSLRIDNNEEKHQLEEFVKYFRVVFYEKNEYGAFDNIQVAKMSRDTNEKAYKFSFQVPISNVFKDKDFSVLKIMTCKELKTYDFVTWESEEDKEECLKQYEKYFEKDYRNNDFSFSFDTPIYSIDKKGNLQQSYRENEISFTINKNTYSSYSMNAKFIVIEDNSSLVFSNKKYEAYVILENPKLTIKEQNFEGNTVEIELQNNSGEQIILITLYKRKLLDFLANLGGIMKIITFMKMTCRFWSSYLYEKSLYNLVVSRKNKFLEEKKAMIESNYYNPLRKVENIKVNMKDTRKKVQYTHYTSYCVWFANRFCKCFYLNKEAKQKRKMLCEILGLENYLFHLDYIDRQIMLENHDQRIANSITEANLINEQNENNIEEHTNEEKHESHAPSIISQEEKQILSHNTIPRKDSSDNSNKFGYIELVSEREESKK